MADVEKTASNGACETILVIEDDEAILSAVQQALEMEGYRVVTAMDGRGGLELLKKVRPPCLILLDLMLPIMNGWEFLEEVKRKGNMLAAIPVVIASAAGSAATTAAKEAQGFIKKPIDLDLLLSTVRKFCGDRAAARQKEDPLNVSLESWPAR